MYTVKQARLRAELTQHQIANALGVNVDTYRRMERDPESATVGRAKAFCKIVGIEIDEIFFDSSSTESRERPSAKQKLEKLLRQQNN